MTRRTGWAVVGLLLLHAGLLAYTAVNNSVTVDEFTHLPAGLAYWRTGAFFICNLSPPLLRLWAALPLALTGVTAPPVDLFRAIQPVEAHWYYADAFLREHSGAYQQLFVMGRLMFVPLSCLGAWVVFRWARELYGDRAGLAACALYAVCPNILAHGSLVGTDAGTMVFMTAAAWLWWRYCRQPSARRWAVAALAVGLAHLCKYAALLLWPVLLVMAASHPARRRLLLGCAGAAVAALVMFNAGYGFQGSGRPLREYPALRRAVPWLRTLPEGVPVPLPRAFVLGALPQVQAAWSGRVQGYLLGFRYRGARWPYYPVTLLCKLPMGTLALLLLAACSLRRRWGRAWTAEEWPLIATGAMFAWGIVVGAKFNVGIRYFLPVLPSVFIFTGRLWDAPDRPRLLPALCTALVLAAGVESAVAAPRYLSFMNFMFRDPMVGYRVVNDSSFDWGQGLLDLKRWMQQRGLERIELAYCGSVDPGVYGIPVTPVTPPGRPGQGEYVAVSAFYLSGLQANHPELIRRTGGAGIPFYRALQRRRPVAVLNAIYIFRRADWDAAGQEPRG